MVYKSCIVRQRNVFFGLPFLVQRLACPLIEVTLWKEDNGKKVIIFVELSQWLVETHCFTATAVPRFVILI